MNRVGRFLLCVALSYALYTAVFTEGALWYQTLSSLNLVLHELGHLLFTPFGQTAHMAGGTLFQWASPLMLAAICYFHKEYLGVGTMLFWLGQSMHDELPYIRDAMALQIDLFGGSIHDWNYLLSHAGILHHYVLVANIVEACAIGIMTAAVVFCWVYSVRLKNNLQRKL